MPWSIFLTRNGNITIKEYDYRESFLEEDYITFGKLFLDIYWKNRQYGKRAGSGARDQQPVVFLTGSPDYAVESYEMQAAGGRGPDDLPDLRTGCVAHHPA